MITWIRENDLCWKGIDSRELEFTIIRLEEDKFVLHVPPALTSMKLENIVCCSLDAAKQTAGKYQTHPLDPFFASIRGINIR